MPIRAKGADLARQLSFPSERIEINMGPRMATAEDDMERHRVVWYGQIKHWSWGTSRHRSHAEKDRCRVHCSQKETLPREESLDFDLLSVW